MELTAAQVIDGALGALGPNGEHWCQGRLTDGNGNVCLAGALKVGARLLLEYVDIDERGPVEFHIARNMVRQVINDEYPDTGPSLGLWNDSLSDFGPVRTVLEKAKANLEGLE